MENHGTDPDIDVDNTPHDEARGKDTQLDRAISEILALLKSYKPRKMSFKGKPHLPLPKLPRRRR